jgi:hypothetical protein
VGIRPFRGIVTPTGVPVFVKTPRGPPQNAIVGVTSDWYGASTEISA